MDECLRAAVQRAVLYDAETGSRLADRLMMSAVDDGFRAAQMIQPGFLFYDGGMILVAVIIFVKICGGQVLYDSAAQSYINDLHTLADAKNRFSVPDAQIQRLELQDVQFCVNVVGSPVSFSEEGGSDVASAGEDQGVASRNLS